MKKKAKKITAAEFDKKFDRGENVMGYLDPKTTKFRDRLNQELKNVKFKKPYEEAGVFVKLAVEIARIREEQGLTQKDLAQRLHTTQQTVSRLEHPGNKSFSLSTLLKLARVFHKRLDIHFI